MSPRGTTAHPAVQVGRGAVLSPHTSYLKESAQVEQFEPLREPIRKRAAAFEKYLKATEPVQVGPEASLDECMAVMGKHRVRHMPVTENGKVLGVISSNDLLNLTLTQQDHIIKQLEQYIAPGP